MVHDAVPPSELEKRQAVTMAGSACAHDPEAFDGPSDEVAP
jgi:hypothetical protein